MKWVVGLSMIAITMGWLATATIPAAPVSIDQTSLKFLPPETVGLAVIDVAGLRTAPLVQDALNKIVAAPKLQQFVDETGVNPQTDIDKVTVAKLGGSDAIVVVQGRIDKLKIDQLLREKGKQADAYLGQTIYYDKDGAVALLDNVVVAGQVDAVKKALDQVQIPGSAPLRSDLMTAIQTIDAGNQVWAVGDFSISDLGTAGIRGPAPVLEMLRSLQSGTYQMRVDNDVHARATCTFADQNSAKNVADLAKGALAVAKLQIAKQQPDLLQVLDGIQVSSSGTTMTVTISESGDLLKKLQGVRTALLK